MNIDGTAIDIIIDVIWKNKADIEAIQFQLDLNEQELI